MRLTEAVMSHELTMLEIMPGRKNMHRQARFICPCGNERITRLTNIKRGLITACVACTKKAGHIKTGLSNRKWAPEISAVRRLIGIYQSNAKRKGISFSLTYQECIDLFTSDCFYCGAQPSSCVKDQRKKGQFIYNGIDRKINTKGYEPFNVVPCCQQCNYAKREMSSDVFISWVKRIYAHSCRHLL
jgi:hypothetical protein